MIKKLLVLTIGLVANHRIAAEPPVYGASSDDFDINSISSYLDDDSSSISDSKVLGGGSGSFSYNNYNQVSHSVPTALPYKAPTPSSYPPLPGSTAATAIHPTFGTSSSLTGSNYYSPPSYTSPVQSNSYGQSSQLRSPFGQPSSHYESHVSFGSDSGSYSTGFKGEHPPSTSFNFPSAEAHSSNINDVRATPQTSYNPSPSPSFPSGPTSYKPNSPFDGSSSSSYKDPYGPNQSFGSSGSQYSGSFGSDSASFGSSYNSRPTSSFDTRPPTSSFDTRPPTSSFDTRPSPSFDSKPFGSSNFGGFGQDGPSGPSGPEGPSSPWSGGQSSYPGFQDGPSPPYRNQYNSGPPPYFKDFTSYKGPNADLPYSPNTPYSSFGPRPHSYSGGYSGRPGPSYRGKYSSGGKGSRYPRHPRPGYTGTRGYSGKHYGSRPSSYRSKSPYPPPHSRHY
ncbi:hypothetical protein GE061_012507 [Apolygus lucorum]|uniref:Mucin-like domain-containing protein n=1 Tax=Apolygus lucorum TaxID=248454 RepID=A0A8S9XSJ7_APOLU|nr:hypothetical protein GE061_012507 [Apolygus lucorum]